MKRHFSILLTLAALAAVCLPAAAAHAGGNGGGHGGHGNGGHHFGRGFAGARNFGRGFGGGFGTFVDEGWDLAELYREMLNNVPYFALHPPVYYSYPVPRTYGYSPFAYPGCVMTPDILGAVEPMEIINPYVPGAQQKAAEPATVNKTAAISTQPQPLVVLNPYVQADKSVAQAE